MRGRLWLHYFVKAVGRKRLTERNVRAREWTEFLGSIMDDVGKSMNCHRVRRRIEPGDKEPSGEYFNIDVVFIDSAEYDLNGEKRDPLVLPRAVVELENSYDSQKISYCLWKILCVRAPIRALICCQSSKNTLTKLKQELETVIWQGSLMKGTDGDLFVIIGDESVAGTKAPWRDYFSVYEWRNDRLEKIEGLEW